MATIDNPDTSSVTETEAARIQAAYGIYRQAMLQTGKPDSWRDLDEQEQKAWIRVIRFLSLLMTHNPPTLSGTPESEAT